MILFHDSRGFRNFKSFYRLYICSERTGMASFFPDLVSYNRFVELMRLVIIPLTYFLKTK
jgi:hypothetical protein